MFVFLRRDNILNSVNECSTVEKDVVTWVDDILGVGGVRVSQQYRLLLLTTNFSPYLARGSGSSMSLAIHSGRLHGRDNFS